MSDSQLLEVLRNTFPEIEIRDVTEEVFARTLDPNIVPPDFIVNGENVWISGKIAAREKESGE